MSAVACCDATSIYGYFSARFLDDGSLRNYRADDFQTLRAEFVHGVLIRVPVLIVGAVVEIDDVENRDAEDLEGDVVVFFGGYSLIQKICLVAQVGGGAPG